MSAYQKHTWVTDEEITSDKLNNMEAGINDALKDKNVVMPEQTLTGGSDGHHYIGPVETIGELIPGEFYAVNLDGVKYIAKCTTGFQYNGVIFHTPTLGTYTDTEPFILGVSQGEAAIFFLNAADTHTISVKLFQYVDVEQLQATAADEGKVLSVVNGKPAWVSLS